MTINASSCICKTAGCPAFGDWAIKNKLTIKWGAHKRGDIVLFDFNKNGTSDHIGIVTAVNNDGSISTIEGNTGNGSNTNGDGVYRRTRYKANVNYFVRPKLPSGVTVDMVIKTFESQVGYKEGTNNTNKYGKWFGMNNVSWCCIFVVWCYSHIIGETKSVSRPTGKYSGSMPSLTIKNGSSGSSVKMWQKFLNWYHYEWALVVDGDFGNKTETATMIFQVTEGLTPDGITGPKTLAAAKRYCPTSNSERIAYTAIELAWPKDTAASKSAYSGGAPTAAFKNALELAYPDRSSWGGAPKKGASCDVGVGTVIRASGVDPTYPRGLDEQWPHLIKSSLWKEVKPANAKDGDVIIYSKDNANGHTCIITNGGLIAEAGLRNYYLKITDSKKSRLSTSGKSKLKVYRAIDTAAKKGADISYIQGNVTKANFINTGLDFIILRLGIRLKPKFVCTVDDVWEHNYKAAKEAGLPVGAYFYSRAINKSEAIEEAKFCIEHLKGKTIDLPMYLDVEDTIRQSKLSKSDLTNVINVWCDEMRTAGIKFGLYASMSWLNSKIDVSKLPNDCGIWVAQYPSTMTEKSAYKGDHDMWQYTSKGKVNGLSGNIDLNYLYK